jgi:hypothetical protein
LLTDQFLCAKLLRQLLRALLLSKLLARQFLCTALLGQLPGTLLLRELLTGLLLDAPLFGQLLTRQFLGAALIGQLLLRELFRTTPLGPLLRTLLRFHLLARQRVDTLLLRHPLFLLGRSLLREFALGSGMLFFCLAGKLRRGWRRSLGFCRHILRVGHGRRFRLGQDEARVLAGLARDDLGMQRFLRRLAAWTGPAP